MNYGFCDLCVNVAENHEDLKKVLQQLCDAGYNTVAINQTVDESVFNNDKKKKKKDHNEIAVSVVPEPFDLTDLKNEFKDKLNIINRITFSFSDPVKTHSLNQLPVLKKYHLYAVVPKSQAAFQHTCSQLNADIITINSSCSGLRLNRKLYLQATERGCHFEIQYTDIIHTSTRKLAIHNSHLFYTFGKSKNVIISSGADTARLIRNPYDVINLARLLGLNESKAKSSLYQQAHHVILKGEGRCYGKGFFKIQLNPNDDSLEDYSRSIKSKKIKLEHNNLSME
ncbi:hypothetical protein QAD02_016830 [Eretmocerus hayati]|uniref:Uncharacterized protein n=1 Tax=Eretmocerus hayati TaxID=131215 RepID=A0ACC2PD88_9HYME|nr:hypothetical protein QAD02_016830 [Eretmocerus hayati]